MSVSDIVGKVGVAQGTFYYYFKTKYDMLDAVMDHYVQENIGFMENVSADKSLNPLEKLQAIISFTLKPELCEKNFIEYLHSDDNLIAHQKYMMKSFETTIPLHHPDRRGRRYQWPVQREASAGDRGADGLHVWISARFPGADRGPG